MSDLLLPHASLDQLRHQAKELLRAAKRGEPRAVARMSAVSERLQLATAHLALAREHGFASWAKLKLEVCRRRILDSCDVEALRELLDAHPELATEPLQGWCDGGRTPPLNHVALLRFDTSTGHWRDLAGTAAIASALLAAGAPVDGDPDYPETPLMTAASYGDAELAKVLVEAGASLTAIASSDAGGVPNGTALRHAVEFGMTEVAEVLLSVGATDLVHAAASGSVKDMLMDTTPERDRVAALRIAAERGKLSVIDDLLAAKTPIDGVDRDGSTALHAAAYSGCADGVRHLLERGADPTRHDTRFDSTPLGWSRAGRRDDVGADHGHDEVEQLLATFTQEDD